MSQIISSLIIREDKKSMSNILASRINALRKVSISVRKMIAEGIIISNIIYMITVYRACSEYLLTVLQVIQNTAARCVTRLGCRCYFFSVGSFR